VLESQILIEIENDRGEVLTVQRWIKHASIRRELISTWAGPKLTEPSSDPPHAEYYVGFGGSAQREAGFHHRLAEFIGWELPRVQKYDGTDTPLYMEVIFPLLFVEQKHGWAGVLANMPDHLQIRDPGARAVEFVLNLDAAARAKRREELKDEETSVKQAWAAAVEAIADRLQGISAVIEGLPTQPSLQWPLQVEPRVRVAGADGWLALDDAVGLARDELRALDAQEVPNAEDAAGAIAAELQTLERDYAVTSAGVSQLLRESRIEREQVEALNVRLLALDEDRQRNLDAKRLRELGGMADVGTDTPHCPTCHQVLSGTLTDLPHSAQVMSVEDNLALIAQETGIFRAMREDSVRVLEAKQQRAAALRERTLALQREIRSAKRALVANGAAPSEATIARRVRLQDRLELLDAVDADYQTASDTFTELAAAWRAVQGKLATLKDAGESSDDTRKLETFQSLLDEQLRVYGFQSLKPESIAISATRYTPAREGFNLGHDISASDMVRLIWSYLLGLLEMSRAETDNHPGILMFDEPRQQDAAEVSFSELLRRASSAHEADQQVIFATSEDPTSLSVMLEGVPHKLHAFDGWVIGPRS